MQPNRRTFLGILGGVAAQAVLPSFARAHRAMRPGVQLYTLRSALAQDFDATLARVAGIGYREVEFAGYFNRTPADVRAVLAKHGLSAPSTHLSYGELQNNWSAAVERAVATGHAFVTIPSLPGNARRTLDDYRRVADAFNAGAAEARKAGLGFAYHNHQYEFAPLEGVVPHPVQYVQQHGKRISMLHLKDSGGAPQHAMRAVGSGVINFPRLLAEAQLAGVAHAFVEHDNPTDAIASIEDSYRYLTQLTK
jgi:sugar phosphate isomerase/epimerase